MVFIFFNIICPIRYYSVSLRHNSFRSQPSWCKRHLLCTASKEITDFEHIIMKVLAFLFATLTAICSQASDKVYRVAIEGEVINMGRESGKVVTAIDCNPWSSGKSRHAVIVDSTGHFSTFVNIPYGHNFTIYYDGTFFCQYAEPGDSLHLTIDASKLKSGARYSGSHAAFNNEYGKAYVDVFSLSFVELPTGKMPKEEYLNKFKEIYSGIEKNFNQYADSVGLNSETRDLMKRSHLFALANNAVDYIDETPEKTLAFFGDSIFGLDDEANLKEMMFHYHYYPYLDRLEEAVRPESDMQMIDAITARHPKSRNRDVLMGIYIKKHNSMEITRISRELFADSLVYNFLYNQEIMNALPVANLSDGDIYEMKDGTTVKSEYTNLTELLTKEYHGKVVYLDLWATWCGSCIEANKSLPEVADFFKNEDIVFVSVALKSDLKRWQKFVCTRPANCADYFISSYDDGELIMSEYGMSGFPAYRIIGRNSELLNPNPPRPNSPAIYDLLNDIL